MNQHLLPMLAVPSAPFDSPEYLFEVKWDGVRALAACGPDGAVWGRDGVPRRGGKSSRRADREKPNPF